MTIYFQLAQNFNKLCIYKVDIILQHKKSYLVI